MYFSAAKLVEKTLAVVEGEMISLLDVRSARRLWRGGFMNNTALEPLFKKTGLNSQKTGLNYMVQRVLLDAAAQEMKLSAPLKAVRQEINRRRKKRKLSKKAFSRLLVRNQFTSQSYKNFIKKSLLRQMVVQREVLENIRISDAALNEYAVRRQGRPLFSSYEYELAVLVFPSDMKGEKAARQAAEVFRENPSSFEEYQLKETNVRKKHMARQALAALHPQVRKAVQNLSAGQTSAAVLIPGAGHHIFKVLWKTPMIQNKNRQKKLFKRLFKTMFQQELKAWLDQKKSKSFVRFNS